MATAAQGCHNTDQEETGQFCFLMIRTKASKTYTCGMLMLDAYRARQLGRHLPVFFFKIYIQQ